LCIEIDKWYSKSTAIISGWTDTTIFWKIKAEIYASRPTIVNTSGHSMVVFWYYNSTISSAKIIRVNLWFWEQIQVATGYYWSNIDYNIDSIFFPNTNQWSIDSIIKVIISK